MGQRSGYVWQYAAVDDSEDLVICLSPAAKAAHWLPNTRWNILYLADSQIVFYTAKLTRMAALILHHARKHGLKRILVTGGSKAGFGALAIAGALAKAAPDRQIICVAFCPQTRVYPLNERIVHMGGYRLLREAADRDERIAEDVRRHGDVRKVGLLPNCDVTLIYNEGNSVDVAEAGEVEGKNVRHIRLPFAFHNVTVPFQFKGMPEARIARYVDMVYAQVERDVDLAAALPADRNELIAAIRDIPWIPPIADAIDLAFAGRLGEIRPGYVHEKAVAAA